MVGDPHEDPLIPGVDPHCEVPHSAHSGVTFRRKRQRLGVTGAARMPVPIFLHLLLPQHGGSDTLVPDLYPQM